jgi:glyoxylase-like metal-dependent hydrolase (beta-lactamase superfamily II)
LIVYHLDKTLTDQLAAIGLKAVDITYVALSHTHGDHIGNVSLFPNSTVLMQRAEYAWISSPDGPNDNVNQLKALARKLLGTPKHLKLLEGDTDVFGDGSVTLVSTPGHTPGSQSLLVHLKNSGFIVLSGDVVHLKENFEKNTVPSLNTDKAASIASMDKIRRMIATCKAKLFINHDKAQSDTLKLLRHFTTDVFISALEPPALMPAQVMQKDLENCNGSRPPTRRSHFQIDSPGRWTGKPRFRLRLDKGWPCIQLIGQLVKRPKPPIPNSVQFGS